MKKSDDLPTTNSLEIEALVKRIESSQLAESDKQLVTRLLRMVMMLLRMMESKNASISRLKKMLFGSDRDKQKQENQTSTATEQDSTTNDQSDERQQTTSDPVNKIAGKTRKGHGRLSTSAYPGAKTVRCIDPLLQA